MSIEEFYKDFMETVYALSDANEDFRESQFFEKMMEYLVDEGVANDFKYTPFRKTGMKADGYELIEDREILNLFVTDFSNSDKLETFTKTDLETLAKRALRFVEKNINSKLYENLEETSAEYDISYFLYNNADRFSTVNIIILTNRMLSKFVKTLPEEQLEGYKIEYDIWDIERLFKIYTSKNKKENFEVNFSEEFGTGIPALPAHNNTVPYESYLCVIPGEILADLYEKYGSRLLEANVRSFLQFRGKINKGIRRTILKEPEMFFAYNNGLTATAQAAHVRNNQIVSLKNLQIVNGGQTTASLYNARKKDKVSLENVFVQMKLTIINDDKINEVIPKISRFANTQNKVNEADFFSNDIFHIRIEEKSRRIWAPRKKNFLKGSKWFYERARGQYLEEQSGLSEAKKREFREIYPKAQMFTKTDLAKYLMCFAEYPHIVSLGAQKNFLKFGEIIVDQWNRNDKIFNDLYFKHAVAKAIIFKTADKIIFKEEWYSGYKANILAYTLASISYLAHKQKKEINFSKIWDAQEIDNVFVSEIKKVSKKVNDYLLSPSSNFKNVSEWAKKEICWKDLKTKIDNEKYIELDRQFSETWLIDNTETRYEEKEAKKLQSIDNEIEISKKLFKIKPDLWNDMVRFGTENNLLGPEEVKLLRLIPFGKVPSARQQERIVKILEKLVDEGMEIPW